MAPISGRAYLHRMSGKVFLSLVVGVLSLIVAATRLAGRPLDWTSGGWLLLGVFCLIQAFVYWRSSRGQTSQEREEP